MTTNKTYKLLRPIQTPEGICTIGTESRESGSTHYYFPYEKSQRGYYISKDKIHLFPDWFLEIKQEEDKEQERKEFVWTDELVLMIVDLAHHNGYHRFNQKCVDLFDEVKKQALGSGYKFPDWIKNHLSKQSKSSPPYTKVERDEKKEKGWKILKYRRVAEGIHDPKIFEGVNYCEVNQCEIYSVKRLSDNTIWVVDQITPKGRIRLFQIENDELAVYYYNLEGYRDTISELFKFPPSPPYISANKPKKEEKQERIEVLGISFDKDRYNGKWGNVIKVYVPYTFKYESESGKEKTPLIKQAIEQVLNDEVTIFGVTMLSDPKQFTKKELDQSRREAVEKCTDLVRDYWKTVPGSSGGVHPAIITIIQILSNYLNSLK